MHLMKKCRLQRALRLLRHEHPCQPAPIHVGHNGPLRSQRNSACVFRLLATGRLRDRGGNFERSSNQHGEIMSDFWLDVIGASLGAAVVVGLLILAGKYAGNHGFDDDFYG